jgi:DNA-binding transcriptional LysR family regulator
VARGLGITIVRRAIAGAGAARQALRIIDIHPPMTRRYTALAWNTARAHLSVDRAAVDGLRNRG